MAIFDAVFEVVAEDRDELLSNSPKARDELLLAAVLAPLASTNVHAKCPAKVWCVDASPSAGAYCAAAVPQYLSKALWRTSERKAKYSRLEPRPRALLRAAGALPPDLEQADFEASEPDEAACRLPREFAFVYDVILVCDGAGGLASACARMGLIVGPVLDLV